MSQNLIINVDLKNSTELGQGSTFECDEKEVKSEEISRVGSKFQCPQCDKLFYDNSNAQRKIKSVHEGVKSAYNKCDYQATDKGNLKKHIVAKQGHLKIHIQSKHEGVKYACNQCDYQATRQDNLKMHVKRVHL